jgi:hypothetical protein
LNPYGHPVAKEQDIPFKAMPVMPGQQFDDLTRDFVFNASSIEG